jgi:hypothetical protein
MGCITLILVQLWLQPEKDDAKGPVHRTLLMNGSKGVYAVKISTDMSEAKRPDDLSISKDLLIWPSQGYLRSISGRKYEKGVNGMWPGSTRTPYLEHAL